MSIMPIVVYEDKMLRKKAKSVSVNENKLREKLETLSDGMFETMYNANGIGLAAPQVGQLIRLIVVDISMIDEHKDVSPLVVVNPHLLDVSSVKTTMEEGCLSIPGVRSDVKRPKKIRLRYRDKELVQREIECDGLLARVLQHEIDHLNGVLFIDKVPKTAFRALSQDLEKVRNHDFSLSYPVLPLET